MKNIFLLFLLFSCATVFSQEKSFEERVNEISRKIERVTEKEKAFLKEKVKSIQLQVDNDEISVEEGKKLKLEAAKFHAKVIEEKVEEIQKELEKLLEDKANGTIKESIETKIIITDKKDESSHQKKRKKFHKHSRRTTSQMIFAFGINNVVNGQKVNSVDNSDYKLWQSHFYEFGVSLKTRITKKASKFYFKYGLSYSWNNLRPDSNKYHVVNGNSTELQTHTQPLSEARLRNVQLILPIHLEYDLSDSYEESDGFKRDRSHNSLRIGFGGFAGLKVSTRQILKYKNEAGNKVKEVQKEGFNTSNLTYGLSTYLAYRSTGVYLKYDLSPLFKNSETRNVSLGVRFDFN